MIRFLNDETVAGHRFGRGAIAMFDAATESALIAAGDAESMELATSASSTKILEQSHDPVTRSSNNSTDTTYESLGMYTLPGGTMNASGKLEIEAAWSFSGGTVGSKAIDIYFGGTIIASGSFISTDACTLARQVLNKGVTNSQHVLNVSGFGSGTSMALSEDMSQDILIEFRCKWSANVAGAQEHIHLVGYAVKYTPGS